MYQVTIGDRALRVAVRAGDDGTFVRVDEGPEVRAELLALHGTLLSLRLNDAHEEVVAVAREHGEVQLALRGLQYTAEVVDEAHARLASVVGARSGAHAHLELKAPMPGLLVRLLCAVGDEVEPAQPLAVLQAMKMENELSLPRHGRVTAVNVTAGQTVEQGQVLVVVE
ncbi:MAG: biotin/lipoyl-binding protein [Chloroflexi bacterium]|nr:biotin/lipoyl-binding protein [Chloroflexota bacterium]